MERVKAACVLGIVVWLASCTGVQDVGSPVEAPATTTPTRAPEIAGPACAAPEDAVLEALQKVITGPAPAARDASLAPWDRKAPPIELDRIEARYGLTATERATLERTGFVVLDRLAYTSYAMAYHELHQFELPVYISLDAILHALFKVYSDELEALERDVLAPQLAQSLERMRAQLPAWSKGVPREIAGDIDLYLAVALGLLTGQEVPLRLGGDAALAQHLVRSATEAGGFTEVDLYGRPRVIDFGAFKPRGHYTSSPEQERYFRGAMWLSRVEFNLVSRDSRSSQPGATPNPEETPREAIGALALADLAEVSGASAGVEATDFVWGAFAGPREDIGLEGLRELRAKAGITSLKQRDAFERLKKTIGEGHVRSTVVHPMPEGVVRLPVIAAPVGARVVPDTKAIGLVVNDRIPGRHRMGAGDIAWMLGHEQAAAPLLEADLKSFSGLGAGLKAGRGHIDDAARHEDLYAGWLSALRATSAPVEGMKPSFMATPAWRDMQMNTALVGYGQLRHANVLLAAESYGGAGCVIPDGYVEPALPVYDALIAWTERAASVLTRLGVTGEKPKPNPDEWAPDDPSLQGPLLLGRFGQTLKALRAIAAQELAGQPLSADQRRFLALVSEIIEGGSGGPPEFNGWYFRLYRSTDSALQDASFISSMYTSSHTQEVAYLGARNPRLGIFVVDSEGAPRAVIGPVAKGYAHHGPASKRLNDEEAHQVKGDAPWRSAFAVTGERLPPLGVMLAGDSELRTLAPAPIPEIQVAILGHHGEVLLERVVSAGPRVQTFDIGAELRAAQELGEERWPSFLRVRVGDRIELVESGIEGLSLITGPVDVDKLWEGVPAFDDGLGGE